MASNPINKLVIRAALRLARTIDEGNFPQLKKLLDKEYLSLLKSFNEFLEKSKDTIPTAIDMHGRTAVYLTDEEITDFKWFMQYREVWKKARQLRPGKLVLNFNSSNQLKDREFYIRES